MPKPNRAPESPAFAAIMFRIQEVTGARTQVQLAEVLDVRQSSISDAKRRQSVPDGWVLTVHLKYDVMPSWILTGEGPRMAGDTAPHKVRQVQEGLDVALAEMGRLSDLVRDAMATARMTEADLIQAKRKAQDDLSQAQMTIEQLTTQVQGLRESLQHASGKAA
jgi:hypothetical protein